MKIFVLSFFFSLSFIACYAQDLKNTEWVKIKVERLDGSKVIDRREPADASLQYFFTADSVLISTNQDYADSRSYSVQDGILKIGDFARYRIDSISDVFLFISQIPNKSIPDSKLNRYYFINADYLYDYLKKNNGLEIEGDSLAICNDQFSPTYLGKIRDLFSNKFNLSDVAKTAKGSFIVSSNGSVKNVDINNSKHFTSNEINKIKSIFQGTSGSWVLPPTPNSLSFKMQFSLTMSSGFGGTFFYFDFFGLRDSLLNASQADEEHKDFNKGAKFFNSGKFEQAAEEFVKCIAIDRLDLDAYYDLASCYQKLGEKEKACEVWKKLKDMGQKNGEMLYDQNCNNQ